MVFRQMYGAALVSFKMFRSFRSLGSGLIWRCFSSELRRSTGEMGLSSTERVCCRSAMFSEVR
jgi:hypothetical protein